MDMILDLSDSVMVLFNGTLLADGTPEEIMKNETVQSAYLGGHYDERQLLKLNEIETILDNIIFYKVFLLK